MSSGAPAATEPAPPPVTARADAPGAARTFREVMQRRRSVRDFSSDPVPIQIIHDAVAAAATAPSGANVQPWRFVVVSDPDVKHRLRVVAEEEERRFYEGRANQEWLTALAPLGTDWHKPFLDQAPYLIIVFEVHQGPHAARPYYAKESVGIATGFLLAALHHAGLATLTHTPSPMRWINTVLQRPREERPYVMIPVGWPAPTARVPAIERKPLSEVMVSM